MPFNSSIRCASVLMTSATPFALPRLHVVKIEPLGLR
jgi:hypothetical protein